MEAAKAGLQPAISRSASTATPFAARLKLHEIIQDANGEPVDLVYQAQTAEHTVSPHPRQERSMGGAGALDDWGLLSRALVITQARLPRCDSRIGSAELSGAPV